MGKWLGEQGFEASNGDGAPWGRRGADSFTTTFLVYVDDVARHNAFSPEHVDTFAPKVRERFESGEPVGLSIGKQVRSLGLQVLRAEGGAPFWTTSDNAGLEEVTGERPFWSQLGRPVWHGGSTTPSIRFVASELAAGGYSGQTQRKVNKCIREVLSQKHCVLCPAGTLSAGARARAWRDASNSRHNKARRSSEL